MARVVRKKQLKLPLVLADQQPPFEIHEANGL